MKHVKLENDTHALFNQARAKVQAMTAKDLEERVTDNYVIKIALKHYLED